MKQKLHKRFWQIGLAVVLITTLLLGGCMSDLASDALQDTNNYYVTNLFSHNGTDWVDTALGGGGGGGGLWQIAGGDTELIIADSLDIQSQFIHNVLNPVLNQDAATKKYVDDADTTLANDIATNASAITTNYALIGINIGNIALNAANIATNATVIATNTANIATNAGNISTNAEDIASNASAIDDIEGGFVGGWTEGRMLLGDGVGSDPLEVMGLVMSQPWAYECWITDPEDAASMWDTEFLNGEIYTKGINNLRIRTNAANGNYFRLYTDAYPGGTYANVFYIAQIQMGGDVLNRDIYAGIWQGSTARRPALTAEHFAFKIVDADIYATVGNGTAEQAEDTGIDTSNWNNKLLMIWRDSGGDYNFYVDGVLTNTITPNGIISFSNSLIYLDIQTAENDNKALICKALAFMLFT